MSRSQWLRKFLTLENGIPTLLCLTQDWADRLGDVVAVDGKALRRSFEARAHGDGGRDARAARDGGGDRGQGRRLRAGAEGQPGDAARGLGGVSGQPPESAELLSHQQVGKGHGRVEKRTATVCHNVLQLFFTLQLFGVTAGIAVSKFFCLSGYDFQDKLMRRSNSTHRSAATGCCS